MSETRIIRAGKGRIEVEGRAIVMARAEGDIEVIVKGDSVADVRVLVDRDMSITTRLVNAGSNIKSSMRIWTISKDVEVSGVLRIESGCRDVDTGLEIRSLGMGGKVVQKPWLEAFSNEIRARHSASMITFSAQQLFYMASRGVSRADAVSAVVEEIMERFSLPEIAME